MMGIDRPGAEANPRDYPSKLNPDRDRRRTVNGPRMELVEADPDDDGDGGGDGSERPDLHAVIAAIVALFPARGASSRPQGGGRAALERRSVEDYLRHQVLGESYAQIARETGRRRGGVARSGAAGRELLLRAGAAGRIDVGLLGAAG